MSIVAKSVLQIIGSMVGLMGCYLAVWAFIDLVTGELLALSVVAPFSAYFGFVSYLTWRRYSPRAVRHICGSTLFLAFIVDRSILKLIPNRSLQASLHFIMLIGFVWLYLPLSRYAVRSAFGDVTAIEHAARIQPTIDQGLPVEISNAPKIVGVAILVVGVLLEYGVWLVESAKTPESFGWLTTICALLGLVAFCLGVWLVYPCFIRTSGPRSNRQSISKSRQVLNEERKPQ